MRKLLRLLLALCIVSALSFDGKVPVISAGENWLPGWGKRIPLTIDHAKIGANLQNFPLLVHLSSASGISREDVSAVFNEIKNNNNRLKIAITESDGITQLYVEVDTWDTANKQAWLWVKVPAVSSQTDTVLYLYFDASTADNQGMVGDPGSAPAQKVWEGEYVMVQHMEPYGTSNPKIFKDSTSHQNNGIEDHNKIVASPQSAAGVIGVAQAFDNSSAITIPDHDDFSVTTTGELTISLWVSESVPNFKSGGFVNFMGKGSNGQYEWAFVIYQRDWTDRSQRISFYMDNPKGGLGSGSYTQRPFGVNEWVHITVKIDDRYTYIYRNGVFERRDFYRGPDAYVEIFPENCNQPVRIGTRDFGTWFEGRIDEVRISNVARTNPYIIADYQSQTDNLINFGVVQTDQPVFSPVSDKIIPAGDALVFRVAATNRNGKPLAYSATGLPAGAAFEPSSQTFSWIPQPNQVGTYFINFAVTDGTSSASLAVKITVNEPAPPVFTPAGDKMITAGDTLIFTVAATQRDNKPLTYSADGLPPGASFDASTRTFSWNPRSNHIGTYVVRFSASDGVLSAFLDVKITVTEIPVTSPPLFTPVGDKTVAAGTNVSFAISAASPEGKILTYSVAGLPPGAGFDASSRTFSWNPQSNHVGTYVVRFSASDGVSSSFLDVKITVTERPAEEPPVFTPVADKIIAAGASVSFTISATSPEGKTLMYSVTGLPPGAGFDPASRVFSWVPQNTQVGEYLVHFAVTDGRASATLDVQITVTVPEQQFSPQESQPVPPPPAVNESAFGPTEQKQPENYSWLVLAGALAGAGTIALLVTLFIRRRRKG